MNNSVTLYIPGDSFFHKCDARVKLLMLAVISVVAYLFFNPWLLLVLFIIAIMSDIISLKAGFKKHMMTKMVIIMFFFLIVLHGFVNPAGHTPALFFGKPIKLPYFGYYTLEGFYMGITNWLRLSSVILTAELFVSTTSPAALVTGLHKLGIPFTFCFMISMSLQLIPIATREATIINSAQRARGLPEKTLIDRFKGLLPMFVPLVVSSLDRMEKMSMALECRGYGNSANPTDLSDITIRTSDIIVIVLFVMLLVVSVFLRLRFGSFNIVDSLTSWSDIFRLM